MLKACLPIRSKLFKRLAVENTLNSIQKPFCFPIVFPIISLVFTHPNRINWQSKSIDTLLKPSYPSWSILVSLRNTRPAIAYSLDWTEPILLSLLPTQPLVIDTLLKPSYPSWPIPVSLRNTSVMPSPLAIIFVHTKKYIFQKEKYFLLIGSNLCPYKKYIYFKKALNHNLFRSNLSHHRILWVFLSTTLIIKLIIVLKRALDGIPTLSHCIFDETQCPYTGMDMTQTQ